MNEEQLTIFTRVNQIEEEIQEAFDPSTFVLNKKVETLTQELYTLRKKCTHKYENGKCIYCGKMEDEN